MKEISNRDFAILLDKLPTVLAFAAEAVPKGDTQAANAVRHVSLIYNKLKKKFKC